MAARPPAAQIPTNRHDDHLSREAEAGEGGSRRTWEQSGKLDAYLAAAPDATRRISGAFQGGYSRHRGPHHLAAARRHGAPRSGDRVHQPQPPAPSGE
jgi:hypothetical protein